MSDARFFRIVASGERDAQKPFCRKCDVIYRGNVRFDSGTEQTAGRDGAEQFHAAGRLAGSLRVRKIISDLAAEDLAADVFAFRSARGDDVCAHWPRREE